MAQKKESPMMEQFRDLKTKHPDALLLFRCGDFYESYEDDAKACASILGITLTHSEAGYAMAGFPHHALDPYLPRLIRAGRRVAICDQLEDPKLTKRLVKRGITELASTATNDNNNNSKSSTTMATKNMAKNEKKNAAQQQVNNEVESVSVGEVTLDTIQPAMVLVEGSEYQVKGNDGKEVTFSSMAPNIGYEPAEEAPAVTMPLGQHGTLVIGGVPKRKEDKPVTLKRKVTLKTKTTEAKPSATKKSELAGMLTKVHLATYTTKRGETAPRIVGFSGEDDPRWKPIYDEKQALVAAYNKAKKKDPKAKMTSSPFGPAWLTDRETNEKTYCMTFGVRYMDVAQALVEAYNTPDRDAWHRAEQAVRDTKAGIVSDYQDEKAARRAERQAKKAAAQAEAQPQGKVYTEQELIDLLNRYAHEDADALAEVGALLKKAA